MHRNGYTFKKLPRDHSKSKVCHMSGGRVRYACLSLFTNYTVSLVSISRVLFVEDSAFLQVHLGAIKPDRGPQIMWTSGILEQFEVDRKLKAVSANSLGHLKPFSLLCYCNGQVWDSYLHNLHNMSSFIAKMYCNMIHKYCNKPELMKTMWPSSLWLTLLRTMWNNLQEHNYRPKIHFSQGKVTFSTCSFIQNYIATFSVTPVY